ncbi:MAG: DUF2079 domain-containing protein [Chloroflexi bacterium]|nr:DUF2079 domain-containing protein [Chloroflexota bacterium]
MENERSKIEDSGSKARAREGMEDSNPLSSTLRGYPPRFAAILRPATLFIILALVAGLDFQFEQGISPFSRRWRWPWLPLDTHSRLSAQILALVPPDVPVSAQSGLYPHLSHRERAYQFPTIADAEYVVLDVTNDPVTLTYDGYFKHVRLALINPHFGPLAAGDGYLLLRRGAPKQSPLIDQFLTFTLAKPEEIEQPVKADFGGALRLEGFTLTILPVIDQRGPHVQLTTFWRALIAIGELAPGLLLHPRRWGHCLPAGRVTPRAILATHRRMAAWQTLPANH